MKTAQDIQLLLNELLNNKLEVKLNLNINGIDVLSIPIENVRSYLDYTKVIRDLQLLAPASAVLLKEKHNGEQDEVINTLSESLNPHQIKF